MPMPKHREPLVKTAVSITVRQHANLEERARREERSVSHFVREALDDYIAVDEVVADEQEPEKVPA